VGKGKRFCLILSEHVPIWHCAKCLGRSRSLPPRGCYRNRGPVRSAESAAGGYDPVRGQWCRSAAPFRHELGSLPPAKSGLLKFDPGK
jgi:hypothetical protein